MANNNSQSEVSTDVGPIWTPVKIVINEKRGSGVTYWSKDFISEVFKNKKTGIQPDMKLIAKYNKETDSICIGIEK